MMAVYSELLYQLNNWLWLISIVIPILVFFAGRSSQSYLIVATVWCASHFINLKLEPWLWELATSRSDNLIYWFSTWASIDALCIALIVMAHRYVNIKLDFEAFSISVCLAGLAFLQIATYLDGVVWQTKLLQEAYTVGVNTGHVANSVILLFPLITGAKEFINSKRKVV
ncbi:hypothetical protein [Pseudoalteromonas sp. S16_S37]|uniref:hypothetical protein n=1 Tax=Pseudoalteromonas sp. S16_S37 TaxID=2720228 RepID=UPI0016802CA9|nr:hypothetical protein [Pseudoalteromonas sp. S16_S37]MBD1584887.1 hypothetical protein [Pseudoalteromonas sp. S16_S37]